MSKHSHADHRTKSHRQASGKKSAAKQPSGVSHEEETRIASEEKTPKPPQPHAEGESRARGAAGGTEAEGNHPGKTAATGKSAPKAEEGSAFEKTMYAYGLLQDGKAAYKGYHKKGEEGGIKGAVREGGRETLDGLVKDAMHSSKETKHIKTALEELAKPHKEFWKSAYEGAKEHILHRGAGGAEKGEGVIAGLKGKISGLKGKAIEFKGELGKKLSTAEGRSGLAKGGMASGANFAGQAGLMESFKTSLDELGEYRSGKKAYTPENGTNTTVKTVMALDPVHAVAKMIPIKGSDHISIERGISHLTGNHGQTLSEMGDETMRQYKHANDIAAGAAYHRKPKTTKAPQMTDYAHLAAIAPQIAKFIPGGKIDGHDVVKEFSKIDMTQSKNYHAYNRALLQAAVEQDQIMQANRSYIPRTMRFGAGADRFNEAETQSSLLAAAQEENGQFLARIHAYNKEHALEVARQQAAAAMKKDSGGKHPADKQGHGVDHGGVVPVHGLPPKPHRPQTVAA